MFYFDQNCCCFDFVHTLSIFNLSTTNSYCFLYLVYAISIYIVPKIHNNNNIIIKNDNIVDLRVSETGGVEREERIFYFLTANFLVLIFWVLRILVLKKSSGHFNTYILFTYIFICFKTISYFTKKTKLHTRNRKL
jgi:hypothetical protein